MRRREDEPAAEWYRRALIKFREADRELDSHWQRLGLHLRVHPERDCPVLDEPYLAALERARDLGDQMLQASILVVKQRRSDAASIESRQALTKACG